MIDKIVLKPNEQKEFEHLIKISHLQTMCDNGLLTIAQFNAAVKILDEKKKSCESGGTAV
jgi:hypothetical protein